MYMVQDPCLKTEISLNFEDGTYLIDPSSSTLQYILSIHINKHSLKLLSQIRRLRKPISANKLLVGNICVFSWWEIFCVFSGWEIFVFFHGGK